MTRFTAAEARELAGPTLDEKVDCLLESIKEAAQNEKRVLRTGWDYTKHKDLWIDGGYNQTEEWKKACDILQRLGFEVQFYYNDGSMAVDMYTVIKW